MVPTLKGNASIPVELSASFGALLLFTTFQVKRIWLAQGALRLHNLHCCTNQLQTAGHGTYTA